MNTEICKNYNMQNAFVSIAYPTKLNYQPYGSKALKANSLSIAWDNVSDFADAKITIYAGNSLEYFAKGTEISINSTSNKNDCTLVFINPLFEYIKIEYTPNSVTAGKLFINLLYGE